MMDTSRTKDLTKPTNAFYLLHIAVDKTPSWFVWSLAVLLLISAGITYRLLASHLKLVVNTPIKLPVPLGTLPLQIRNWNGTDLSIPSTTRKYMESHFADDFLSRRYISATDNAWADVYIVYCSSRPGGMLGHQPRVCYPGFGWIYDGTELTHFVSRAGRHVPCLIHRFHKPAPTHQQTVVLNFYILNGQTTADEKDFSGLLGRRPNIARDPARYVAQVQISSVLENSVRTAAKDTTDLILDFLPDENGEVRAINYANATGDSVK
ncbi:MAG: exosortase-associated EpsI family protein [bacterium]